MNKSLMHEVITFSLYSDTSRWFDKIITERAGYYESKGYSKRGMFKRNRRKEIAKRK